MTDWWKENVLWVVAMSALLLIALSFSFLIVVAGVQIILRGVTDCPK